MNLDLALNVLDEMATESVVTVTKILDSAEPWSELQSKPHIRSALSLGVGYRLAILDEVRDRIVTAAIHELEDPDHEHKWVDVRNEFVKSGELCLGCGAIRAGNVDR